MKTRTAVIAAAAGLMGLSASADTVTMEYTGTGLGRTVRVSSPERSGTLFAGQLRHEVSSGTGIGASLAGQSILTYCIDIAQGVATRPTVFDVSRVDSNARSATEAALSRMVGHALDYAPNVRSNGEKRDFHAAVQLAVWEVIADFDATDGRGSLSIEQGRFEASQSNGRNIGGRLLDYVDDLFNAAMSGTGTGLAMTSSSRQDQIIPLTDPIIPAPTAAAMALVGVGGLASRRRR
ncbi:MAG: Cys-Gln thioester bond-forming surface protein [Planctomycetota bacterium]